MCPAIQERLRLPLSCSALDAFRACLRPWLPMSTPRARISTTSGRSQTSTSSCCGLSFQTHFLPNGTRTSPSHPMSADLLCTTTTLLVVCDCARSAPSLGWISGGSHGSLWLSVRMLCCCVVLSCVARCLWSCVSGLCMQRGNTLMHTHICCVCIVCVYAMHVVYAVVKHAVQRCGVYLSLMQHPARRQTKNGHANVMHALWSFSNTECLISWCFVSVCRTPVGFLCWMA